MADHASGHDVMLIYFGRGSVDMDNVAVLLLVPQVRVVFHHVIAHTNDYVGPIKATGYVIVRL